MTVRSPAIYQLELTQDLRMLDIRRLYGCRTKTCRRHGHVLPSKLQEVNEARRGSRALGLEELGLWPLPGVGRDGWRDEMPQLTVFGSRMTVTLLSVGFRFGEILNH
jgi:hypothetical protein